MRGGKEINESWKKNEWGGGKETNMGALFISILINTKMFKRYSYKIKIASWTLSFFPQNQDKDN